MTILLYHGVTPKENFVPPAQTDVYNYRKKFIVPEDFEHQMRFFAKRYAVLDLDEAIQKLYAGTLPPYALAITFDDGYRNFYTHAYPVLKKFKLPATMFVVTDFVCNKRPLWVDRLEYAMGKKSGTYKEKITRDAEIRARLKKLPAHEREAQLHAIEREAGVAFTDFEDERSVYAPLSASEIREMQEDGFTFGAHTKSHPILSREHPDRIEEEVVGSKQALGQVCGSLSRVFAYPNGQPNDWDKTVEGVLKRNGFIAALTTLEGTNTQKTDAFRLRRMVMDGTDGSTFASVASGVQSWLRTARSYV